MLFIRLQKRASAGCSRSTDASVEHSVHSGFIWCIIMSDQRSYPVEFDEHAGFPVQVSVRAVLESGAPPQHGAVELAGAFGIVAHLAAVILDEVLIRDADVVLHRLLRVIIGCRETQSVMIYKAINSFPAEHGFSLLYARGRYYASPE